MLHNIVIEMEKEGVGMPRGREDNYIEQVPQVADEGAIGVRDVLPQYMIQSGEEEQEAATIASDSEDENKEHQR